MEKKETRVIKVLEGLSNAYPDAPPTYLNYGTPFEMLIATILSARSTDAGINKLTPTLFQHYPDPQSLAKASHEDVAPLIKAAGAYNRKATYIIETSRMLVKEFDGKIPRTIDEMVLFPGVSRKTANVVLSVVFGINEGIVVDTHIGRVSQRLGFSENKSAAKIEMDLMEVVPKKQWHDYARLLGAHGRRTCKSRKPHCPECSVNEICPSAEIGELA